MSSLIQPVPRISLPRGWPSLFAGDSRRKLAQCLCDYARSRRWFAGKARTIKTALIRDIVPLSMRPGRTFLCLVEMRYARNVSEVYQVPVALAVDDEMERVVRELPGFVIAQIDFHHGRAKGVLYEAVQSPDFARGVLNLIARQRSLSGEKGVLRGTSNPGFHHRAAARSRIAPRLLSAEQSNSSIVLSDRMILKLFRRLRPGANPEVEIARFLAAETFPHVPPFVGAVQYRRPGQEDCALAILHDFFPNSRDGWQHALEAVDRFFRRLRRSPEGYRRTPPSPERHWLEDVRRPVPVLAKERLGPYYQTARVLGERTADLHLCLASARQNKDFAPEAFGLSNQRALFRSVRREVARTLALLRSRLDTFPVAVRTDAIRLLNVEQPLLRRLRADAWSPVSGWRLRVHGDYHLGQLLRWNGDFFIMDFEGEPARSLSERRAKHSPLRDVAGMLRSFDYAAFAGLRRLEGSIVDSANAVRMMHPWARYWAHWVGVVFLDAYLKRARAGLFLPTSQAELRLLLDLHLLQKAIYELAYELNHRPDWISIPLRGLIDLIGQTSHLHESSRPSG